MKRNIAINSPAEHSSHGHGPSSRTVALSIGAILVVYIAATAAGWTTAGGHGEPSAGAEPSHPVEHEGQDGSAHEHGTQPGDKHEADDHKEDGHEDDDHGHGPSVMPAFWAVIPFALLLGAIAVFPLIAFTEHWWEENLHRFYVAAGLAAVTLLYYILLHTGGGWEKALHVLDHAILQEYIPFIVLLFALYTISGGIRIEGDLAAHPATNAAFITVGGLLASFIGTTGAAMLLIRPLIDTNHERKYVQHTVIFFIFVVCNCGGCLLPIGDPPLFLGYLQGG